MLADAPAVVPVQGLPGKHGVVVVPRQEKVAIGTAIEPQLQSLVCRFHRIMYEITCRDYDRTGRLGCMNLIQHRLQCCLGINPGGHELTAGS